MGIRDLTSALTGGRAPKKQRRADRPRTILPGLEDDALSQRARSLGAPKGATSPAGPLDVARLDAARERLRRQIDPVRDEDLEP